MHFLKKITVFMTVASFVFSTLLIDAALINSAQAGYSGQGYPLCGGVVNGKLQRACKGHPPYTVLWQMPRRTQHRGLFAVPGAKAVADKLLKNGDGYSPLLDSMAKVLKTKPEVYRAQFKKELETPHTSPKLAAFVFNHVINAYLNNKMTTDERKVFAAFGKHYGETRFLIAHEALRHYDNWLEARQLTAAKFNHPATTLANLGYKPPDFNSMAVSVLGVGAAGAFASAMIATAVVSSVSAAAVGGGTTSLAVAGLPVIAAKVLLPNAVLASGSAAGGTAAVVAGPLMILAMGAIIAGLAIDHIIKVKEARPKLVAARAAALKAWRNGYGKDHYKKAMATHQGVAEALVNFASMIAHPKPIASPPTYHAWLEPQLQKYKQQVKTRSGQRPVVAGGSGKGLDLSKLKALKNNQQTVAIKPPTMKLADGKWVQMPGRGLDVGAGSMGAYGVVGTDAGVYLWNTKKKTWAAVTGKLARLDVAGLGTLVGVNSQKAIWRRGLNGKWVRIPGSANDIGIGAGGSIWVIGTNKEPGGYGIYRLVNGKFKKVPGSAVRIDVAPDGNAWIVNAAGNVFQYNGRKWVVIKGAPKAKDIGIGATGGVALLDKRGAPYLRIKGKWIKLPGSGSDITVDQTGAPWVIGGGNAIFRWQTK